jgi:alkylated DNA repair dioxygenase AlkB
MDQFVVQGRGDERLSKKKKDDQIPGLRIVENFLSAEEEKTLLAEVDKCVWDNTLSRRTQHYGFVYSYSAKNVAEKTSPIPEFCTFVCDRLIEQHLIQERPDQMIVNEYQPGQGINGHIDSVSSFEDGIVSISMGSSVIMEFSKGTEKREHVLQRLSAIVLHGEARFEWKHAIPARKSDHGVARDRRVSLTFRKVKQAK